MHYAICCQGSDKFVDRQVSTNSLFNHDFVTIRAFSAYEQEEGGVFSDFVDTVDNLLTPPSVNK